MDPLIGSSLITGATGLLGGLFGMFGQNKNIDKQIAAQKEENAVNRGYNLNLAKLQNQWSIEQWNRENAYNTPAAQYQRLVEAGLNPDLMYQNGGISNVAGASPEMTSGAPSTPVDMSALGQKMTYGEVVTGALNQAITGSRISAMQSESKKREREGQLIEVQTGIASADLVTRAAQNELALKFTNSQIYLNHALADESHARKEEIAAKITNLNAQTDKLLSDISVNVQRIKNMDAEVVQMQFERWYKSKELDLEAKRLAQEIKESGSRIALNEQTCKDMLATLSARLLNLNSGFVKNQAEAEKAYAELGIVDINMQHAQYNLDVAKDWTTFDKLTDGLGKFIGSIGVAVGSIFGLKRGKKPPTTTSNGGRTINQPYWDGSPSY